MDFTKAPATQCTIPERLSRFVTIALPRIAITGSVRISSIKAAP